jgi:hypothetical protein
MPKKPDESARKRARRWQKNGVDKQDESLVNCNSCVGNGKGIPGKLEKSTAKNGVDKLE